MDYTSNATASLILSSFAGYAEALIGPCPQSEEIAATPSKKETSHKLTLLIRTTTKSFGVGEILSKEDQAVVDRYNHMNHDQQLAEFRTLRARLG